MSDKEKLVAMLVDLKNEQISTKVTVEKYFKISEHKRDRENIVRVVNYISESISNGSIFKLEDQTVEGIEQEFGIYVDEGDLFLVSLKEGDYITYVPFLLFDGYLIFNNTPLIRKNTVTGEQGMYFEWKSGAPPQE